MQFQRIYSDAVAEPPPGLWSNCLRVGNQVFVAGMVALDKEGKLVGKRDSFAQAKFIFECIQHYLIQAGGAMSDIASLIIFVTDMTHRPGVLEARRLFFAGDFPCSTLVAVSQLIDPDMLVEINAVAFVGASRSSAKV
jgi:enamine deaminase RidA (YjgF/YER057c/UK114 family)